MVLATKHCTGVDSVQSHASAFWFGLSVCLLTNCTKLNPATNGFAFVLCFAMNDAKTRVRPNQRPIVNHGEALPKSRVPYNTVHQSGSWCLLRQYQGCGTDGGAKPRHRPINGSFINADSLQHKLIHWGSEVRYHRNLVLDTWPQDSHGLETD